MADVFSKTSSWASSRPAPTTWQEEDQRRAEDLYNREGSEAVSNRERAGEARDTYRTAADTAYRDATNPGPSNLSRFSAVNTQGYQPTQVAQWLSSMTMAPKPSVSGGGSSGGGVAMRSATGVPSASAELQAYSPSALSDFDPAAYGKQYAEGAYGDFKLRLGDELQSLENRSVGSGRLRTGLFDRDQGQVITRNTESFNNALAQAATTFSGQRAGVLTSAEQLRLARAQGIDANTLEGTRIANTAAEQQRQAALAGERNALDLYGAETARYGLGLQGAEFADQQGYSRASDLDRYAFNQATGLDAQDATRRQTGLDAALAREARYMQDYNTAADRSSEYASANRDWTTQQRLEQDARDELLRRKQASATMGAGGVNNGIYKDPNEQVALSFGVPYRK